MIDPPCDPPPRPAPLPDTARFARVSVGTILDDRFEVVGPIGTGGNAAVYRCKDRALRSMVAVKVLTEPQEQARRRFLDEGRILANLRSPHLVQVLAVGEVDPHTPYMALELLPGQNLDTRLRQEGPLPWREVLELLVQVAAGVAALHRYGVLHRDIKPANIVQIESTTERPFVKVIDLGIAKVSDWDRVDVPGFTASPRHQTDGGLIVGTVGFYPPEAGLGAPDTRYDVYGLGATLYLLCTGVMPKRRVSPTDAYVIELPTMNTVHPACGAPPELESLIQQALAALPEDRVPSMEEFQRRLEAIRATHTDEATPHLFAGCFEMVQPLSAGAHGEVHKAYHRDAPCYVALKLLKDQAKAYPVERAYFAREARVLRAVEHPALPRLVECRTSARHRQPYIAMTLAPGKPAGEFCIAGNNLEPADVLAVGKCLAGALAALHARGILHRDVHASNVLIDVERRPTTATLIDLGRAELEDKFYALVEDRYPTRVEDRVKLGSCGLERLEWAAPEARAGRGWTGRSDVYSLGLLLYRLLTGKRPTTPKGELLSPRIFRPNCPPALASALLAALNPNPDERPDARGLLAMLDAEEMFEEPAPAESLPVHRKVRPGRLPRAWASAGVAGVGGLAALVLVLVGRDIMQDHEPAEPPRVAVAAVSDSDKPEPVVAAPDQPLKSYVPANAADTRPLPTMRDALAAAAPQLRDCSRLTDGLLMVEFTTEPARDQFVKVAVRGYADARVDHCVQDATAALRFEPREGSPFVKEYMP